MSRRKRPASAEWEEPSLGSTDALCRAVKRLHTYSPATSSCTTSKAAGNGAAAAEPEVSSATGVASRLGAATICAEPAKPAELGVERRPLAVDNRLPPARAAEPAKEPKPPPAPRQPADAGAAPELQAAPPPPPGAKQAADAPGLQLDVARLQRRMEHVAVSGAGGGGDAVAQPGTPVQREGGSPAGGKGRRLGTRGEAADAGSAAYALLYEEANELLKNLHFARLQRSAGGRDG